MQNTFGRVLYYVFIIMAILANGTLHLNALISPYRLEGKLFNAGLWESCVRFKCVKILDNAHLIPGNFLLILLLLYCYLTLLHYWHLVHFTVIFVASIWTTKVDTSNKSNNKSKYSYSEFLLVRIFTFRLNTEIYRACGKIGGKRLQIGTLFPQ